MIMIINDNNNGLYTLGSFTLKVIIFIANALFSVGNINTEIKCQR